MRFKLTLYSDQRGVKIPVNYQYPLSAAIYKIINQGDAAYAAFLHEHGYGKGFKLFTFSQINCPFRIDGDRFVILGNELSLEVAFHLPEAAELFIKGLFQSAQIDIADWVSKGSFTISSVEKMNNPLSNFDGEDFVSLQLKLLSPLVVGLHNSKGNYTFLSPEDQAFADSLLYNWREKIKTCFDEETAAKAVISANVINMKNPPRSRLITIKAGKHEETKIRAWFNFQILVSGEKRVIELLLNCGAGVYNSMGCGMVEEV